jgi:DNA-binding MarR family transcriptional regulator
MGNPRPIGFWLKLVDQLIDDQFAATLEEHGVTRRQWQLLNVLHREPSTVVQLDAAVAPFLSTDDDESSVDHLSELVDSEWVIHTDGVYTLTDRGSAAFERLSEVVGEQRTIMTAGLSEGEYDQTIAVLERIARNLGWSD